MFYFTENTIYSLNNLKKAQIKRSPFTHEDLFIVELTYFNAPQEEIPCVNKDSAEKILEEIKSVLRKELADRNI